MLTLSQQQKSTGPQNSTAGVSRGPGRPPVVHDLNLDELGEGEDSVSLNLDEFFHSISS